MVIFVKKNHMLPVAVLDEDVKNISGVVAGRYEWIGFAEDAAEYVLYEDDGVSKKYTPQENWKKIVMTREELGMAVC